MHVSSGALEEEVLDGFFRLAADALLCYRTAVSVAIELISIQIWLAAPQTQWHTRAPTQ
jgi:hypothetical protein